MKENYKKFRKLPDSCVLALQSPLPSFHRRKPHCPHRVSPPLQFRRRAAHVAALPGGVPASPVLRLEFLPLGFSFASLAGQAREA